MKCVQRMFDSAIRRRYLPSRDLHMLDAHMPVHRQQYDLKGTVNILAAFEPQPMVQVIQHFRQHDGPVLVHHGRCENL